MALKDWKKAFENNSLIIFKKGDEDIIVGYEVKAKAWHYQNHKEYNYFFKNLTKSAALKFAKSYMRKH